VAPVVGLVGTGRRGEARGWSGGARLGRRGGERRWRLPVRCRTGWRCGWDRRRTVGGDAAAHVLRGGWRRAVAGLVEETAAQQLTRATMRTTAAWLARTSTVESGAAASDTSCRGGAQGEASGRLSGGQRRSKQDTACPDSAFKVRHTRGAAQARGSHAATAH
jgi:hypothetical protein